MRQPFVPIDFNSPQKSLLGDYYLVPIKISNTQEDLDAILSNANAITTIRGGSGSKDKWPYIFSLKKYT